MRALGIFAQAPVPGRVKSRLAADVGDSTAVEIYMRIGRRVVDATAGAAHRTVIWFAPSGEAAYVREWLDGFGRVEFRPQASGPLGRRLDAAFARHFAEGAERTVIIATDCPGLDRRLVRGAFAALDAHDVVLGPTLDGGCYLLGLREPQPALFTGLPWATAAVAARARARAAALRLRLSVLHPLRDVDTVRDARALGYLNS